jgi:F-type H+-transporting ATPase subunit b
METLTQGLQPRDMIALLVTHIVAFLIFLAILRRFAWGPLLRMIDARREKIRSDYAAAQGKLDDAESLRGDFEQKLAGIKVTERERTQEAVKRGEEIAAKLEAEAKGKASDYLHRAEHELDRDVASARLALRAQVVEMSIAAAEKLIKEKLDDAKHRQLVEDFIQDLGDIRG